MDQHINQPMETTNTNNDHHYDMEPLSMDNEGTSPGGNPASNAAASTTVAAAPPAAMMTKPGVHKAKSTLKKSWRKPKDKPKRPLSAYNLFFQHEREKIISCNPDATLEETLIKISSTPKPKKRRHRKSHGKIGFADLARTIAEKWKTLAPEGRSIYETKAAQEKQRYKKELEEWSKAREQKAKEDEKKSPLELARVEVVYDEQQQQSPLDPRNAVTLRAVEKAKVAAAAAAAAHPHDSLSSIILRNAHMSGQAHSGELRDYLKMTQQTIDMARASLSLPLFANLGVANMANNMMSAVAGGGTSALEATAPFMAQQGGPAGASGLDYTLFGGGINPLGDLSQAHHHHPAATATTTAASMLGSVSDQGNDSSSASGIGGAGSSSKGT
mmetsp:Transcript_7491/g.17153  ORF Transcript_7491/g.17153 Transcript_7491/m.17153 type:complete len:386 (-) Transcript_7491:261-1418(-)|eukprot:CAMPEP_0116842560 /NCGR_PEP_ID=MMETSP0418-20121206/11588_1 /TAXON_ID=1158023 /ORGANISM="Astrosyne radiata, Strain 13vi08-1A" /LENGTH=385 /DNA_ID=CAMNT_0004473191 /DNA_START=117 /DNA_END=1274 /DNA_ORIENTATION=+